MIKINALVETWVSNKYDAEAITNEYQRLYNCFWALYENGIITKEQRDNAHSKLNKALDIIGKRNIQ